jgi:glycosyltransferase involved in cell wall biosynthesis
MKIGVDATCWQNARGYGRHARGLLSTLMRLDAENRYTLFMDSPFQWNSVPAQAEVRMVHTSAPTAVAASANGHRSVSDLWRMSRALSDPAFDLLLFPTIYSYVPVLGRSKKVVMIHDTIAEKYPELTVPTRASRLFWKSKVALGRRQADAITTISEYSRKGIIEHFQISPERVFVVGEASDPIFRVLERLQPTPRLIKMGFTSGTRSIVYVGGFSPHKNLEKLVDVFANLSQRTEFLDVRLVMVGEYEKEVFHSYFGTIKNQVERLGLTERVIFTGYLPDDELVVLLNLSTVLVLPSLMEGFGLPAIEAAACGCPVVATHASPLPSVLSDGGIYIDPTQPDDLQSALVRVLSSESLRRRMREAGLAAAARFTWDKAAHEMLEVIKKVTIQ